MMKDYVTKDAPHGFADLPPFPIFVEEKNDEEVWIRDLQSHNVVVIRNCSRSKFAVRYNQRLRGVVMLNCNNCQLQILDSAVLGTRECSIVNCNNCEFVLEDVDIRTLLLYSVKNSSVVLVSSPPLTELTKVYWRDRCENNQMKLACLLEVDLSKHAREFFGIKFKITSVLQIPDPDISQIVSYVNSAEMMKTKKSNEPFEPASEHMARISEMETTLFPFTADDLAEAYKQEKAEHYDSPEEIRVKAKQVAEILREANHTVCHTGAGVSTSANIPDFRGPNGMWTNLEKGKFPEGMNVQIVCPTYTHYAITHLMQKKLIRFLISSNVDGLHTRSGVPPHLIVEAHGNMYKEVCEDCGMVYFRGYSVRGKITISPGGHYTGWRCEWCKGQLRDTNVGFGENLNENDLWVSLQQIKKSDVSIILGTSMNVQPSVSVQMYTKRENNKKVILVNLQKTPVDGEVDVRVYAKTDDFMRALMEELTLVSFDQTTDSKVNWISYDKMRATQEHDHDREEVEEEEKSFVHPIMVYASLGVAALGVAIWWFGLTTFLQH